MVVNFCIPQVACYVDIIAQCTHSLIFLSIHVGSTDFIGSGRTSLKDDGSTNVENLYSETTDHYSAISTIAKELLCSWPW